MKKTLKITGIVLLLLILAAILIPVLFKDKITAMVKTEINNSLTAKVDFADVDLSLFRHFPKLAVALDSLRVTGTGEFEGDTLASAKRIDLALDLLSLFGSEMTIHSVTVDHPRVHAIILANGHPNWNITKPDTATAQPGTAAASKPFKMALQKYSINDGYISYRDDAGNMRCEIGGLNHSGKGDFTSDLFTLETSTQTASLSFTYGGVPYLIQTHAKVDANFQVDNKTAKYSFKVDDMSLNDLRLHTEGFFQLVNDSTYDMDIAFNGPSLDFKSILSLIPAIYKQDFGAIRTSGTASLAGFVKGRYDSRHIPAYHVDLEVKDGSFQYPDLPKPLKNIAFSLKADNPDGVSDHTVVDIPKAHLEMDGAPFDFRLLLKTPVSDMYIDAAAKGRLDLGRITQYVKLDNGTKLQGILDADISAKGNFSAIEKKQLDKFNAAGAFALTGFSYASPAYPTPVTLDNLHLTFNPKNVTLDALKGSYGKTHYNANGSLDNLLPYMLKNQTLEGSLTVQADQVNLDELMGSMPKSADSSKSSTANGANTSTTGNAAGTAQPAATATPFAVPNNLKFALHTAIGQLQYGNLQLNNLGGDLVIADETVRLQHVRAEGLDGTMTIDGAYSTKVSKKNPAIAFAYDVQKLDVQKTFVAFNTVQKLMPAAKYIAGKFSSTLTMSGLLQPDMTADLNSLSGEGNLLLANAALKNFAPTDQLAETLHLDQLKDLSLNDVKTHFTFKNGRVLVDPFHIKVQTIDMEVGGSHGFDQSLDYTVDMQLPRSLLGGQVNGLLGTALSALGSQNQTAKNNDKIHVPVRIGGTVTKPTVKPDLKAALTNTVGSAGAQAKDLVKARVDSAKNQLKDTVTQLGKNALSAAGNQLKDQILGGAKDSTGKANTLEDTKKKAQEAGKDLLNGLFNKKKSN